MAKRFGPIGKLCGACGFAVSLFGGALCGAS
jgi:hypothetical protein